MSESDQNGFDAEKSKTRKKLEAEALQTLGIQLTRMSADELSKLPLPDELSEAVRLAQKINQRGGHKRQLQYIGKIMRTIDPGPIETAIRQLKMQHSRAVSQFHQLEQWRDQLLANDPDIMDTLVLKYPNMDRQHLRQLVRNASSKNEKLAKKSKRALFRFLQQQDNPHQGTSD